MIEYIKIVVSTKYGVFGDNNMFKLLINHFRKPKKTFNRTLVTAQDYADCIGLFMYENTLFNVNSFGIGVVCISLYNQNIFAFGFMRRVALLKAEVARNLPVGLRVHWTVVK